MTWKRQTDKQQYTKPNIVNRRLRKTNPNRSHRWSHVLRKVKQIHRVALDCNICRYFFLNTRIHVHYLFFAFLQIQISVYVIYVQMYVISIFQKMYSSQLYLHSFRIKYYKNGVQRWHIFPQKLAIKNNFNLLKW